MTKNRYSSTDDKILKKLEELNNQQRQTNDFLLIEILKEIEELNKKQQLTNELLLANYHILQEHIQRQNSPVALLSERLDDYFTENVLQNSTNKRLKWEIGGLYKDLPVCRRCGYRRFMIPFTLGEKSTTWTCRHCGEDTTVEQNYSDWFHKKREWKKKEE